VVGMRHRVGWLPPARYGLPFSHRGSGVKVGRMPISEADAVGALEAGGARDHNAGRP
jgi:hypothetical protein